MTKSLIEQIITSPVTPINRQDRWRNQGVTEEGIENHLSWERRKSKKAREQKKKNNEKNRELIKQIKKDLIGKTFGKIKITKINEATDGVGFWWHCYKHFSDGSAGTFKYFYWFEDFSLEEFIKDIKYV